MPLTVLLTGASGFLGGHVFECLRQARHDVIILKRATSNLGAVSNLTPAVRMYDAGAQAISDIFEQNAIDVVVHTATTYGRKGESASDIVASNVVLPLDLLERAGQHGVSTFVSTDSFFNVKTELPGALNLYTLTKAHFRDYAMRLAPQAGICFVNLRVEHMYGPRDDATKFVPSLLTSLLLQQPSIEMTPGDQLRDFIFVEDVAHSYAAVIASRKVLGPGFHEFEVGSGVSTSIREFSLLARELAQSATQLEFGALEHRRGEIMVSRAAIDSLVKLGWRPRTGLREGLTATIASLANGAPLKQAR